MWEFLTKLKDFLSLNFRSLFIVAFVSWVLIFIPTSLWETYGLLDLFSKTKPWIFLITIISSVWILSAGLYDIFVYIKNLVAIKEKEIKEKKHKVELINSLSKVEKEILARYIAEDTTTIAFDARDGIVNGLIAKGILYRSSQASNPFTAMDFDTNLQFWAWTYLKDHPDFLNEINPREKGRHQL